MRSLPPALLVACGLVFPLAGCGPAPGWVEEPETAAPAPTTPPPAEERGKCRMSTSLVRLQARYDRQRAVDGWDSGPCVAPSLAP